MQAVSRVRGRWGFTGRSRASSLYALVLWVRLTVYGTSSAGGGFLLSQEWLGVMDAP